MARIGSFVSLPKKFNVLPTMQQQGILTPIPPLLNPCRVAMTFFSARRYDVANIISTVFRGFSSRDPGAGTRHLLLAGRSGCATLTPSMTRNPAGWQMMLFTGFLTNKRVHH